MLPICRYCSSHPAETVSRIILNVAVPSPLHTLFDYLPPANCPNPPTPGVRVKVPFGRVELVGVIVSTSATSEVPEAKLRLALDILDAEPVLSAELMKLARFAYQYYLHAPGEVFANVLPVALRKGRAAKPVQIFDWKITEEGAQALESEALKRAPKQKTLLAHLAAHPNGLGSEALREFMATAATTLRDLDKKKLVQRIGMSNLDGAQTSTASGPKLSDEQQIAVDAVTDSLDQFGSFLLDGVTGSGKTEVYLHCAQAVLNAGRQVLVLVPEIGLTPQLLERFVSRLGVPLAIMHSGLTDLQRLHAWLAARSGEARVVIGTRSAVYAPLPEAGMIIIDEEHDLSFKQHDGLRYHARDLAVVRAREAGIPIILGSATPSMECLQNVRSDRFKHLLLTRRAGAAKPPRLELLDVRNQTMEDGLSAPLVSRIKKHLHAGGQVLLFLNRRGFAPTLICHECGWIGKCARCDANMTLHLRRQRLICHHCAAEQPVRKQCPDCGSLDLRPLGQGTERLENVLSSQFPEYKIARVDRDTTRRKGSLEALLKEVHSGEAQILIGTQMLAKGHHFPEVTLVAIVDTDQGLFSADFRSGERMAQVILQVAGRAGRAEKPGTVLIQTHHPDHPLLQMLVNQGYPAVAESTLAERYDACLPPFSFQALLRAEAVKEEQPETFLQQARDLGQPYAEGVELWGPVPAPMERRAGRYRAQLLIQAERRSALHAFLRRWRQELEGLKSARQVRWSLDIDPVDLM